MQGLDESGQPRGSPIQVAGADAFPVTELEFTYNRQLKKTLLAWVTSDSSSFPSKTSISGRLLGPGQSFGPVALFYTFAGGDGSVRVAPTGRAFLVSWLREDGAILAATYDPSAKQVPLPPTDAEFPIFLPDVRTVWTKPSGDDVAYISWELDPASGTGLVAWTQD